MVSPFDSIAWVDHAPLVGIEVVMPNSSRFSKQNNNAAGHSGVAAQTEGCVLEGQAGGSLDKMERVLNDFFEEARVECRNWSPEEKKQRAAACVSEAMGHVDTHLGVSSQIQSRVSAGSRISARQIVRAIAEGIRFG